MMMSVSFHHLARHWIWMVAAGEADALGTRGRSYIRQVAVCLCLLLLFGDAGPRVVYIRACMPLVAADRDDRD
jgi:hypothetical protein